MRKTTVTFMVLLALLLALPLFSYAGHGHGHNGGTRVFIGGSLWLGPPPVIVQQPPVYVQRGQAESEYWYYCDNPQGFYPYIKSCPGGWMKVVPETVPPNR